MCICVDFPEVPENCRHGSSHQGTKSYQRHIHPTGVGMVAGIAPGVGLRRLHGHLQTLGHWSPHQAHVGYVHEVWQ